MSSEVKYFLALEGKLLRRSKLARTIFIYGLIMTILLCFLGFFILQKQFENSYIFNITILVISSSFLPIYYGAFIFSWQSSFYDFLVLLKKEKIIRFIISQYIFYAILVLLSFFLIFPFIFYKSLVLESLAVLLFYISSIPWLVLYLGLENKQFINLVSTTFFDLIIVNNKRVFMVVVIALPIIIISGFEKIDFINIGISIIGVLGAIVLIYTKGILRHFNKAYNKKIHIQRNNFKIRFK